MWLWLSQHSAPLSVLANLGMLVVWTFYAQLMLNSLLKQRRPRVLINVGKGRDLDAEIIIANMSEEKIFIQLLLALVYADGQEYTQAITDVYFHADDDSERITERTTSQGPLSAGGDLRLGSFRQVAQQVSPRLRTPPWQALKIRLVFFYGSRAGAVAASRDFRFEKDANDKPTIRPDQLDTAVLHRFWHRRKIRRWLRDYG